MIEELKEIYDYYLSLDEEGRIASAKDATNEVLGYFARLQIDEKIAANFFIALLAIFINADNKITNEEVNVFNGVIGTNFDLVTLESLIGECKGEEIVNELNEVIDSMPAKIKSNVVIIGLTLICADNKLSEEEIELFEEILA